MTRASGTARSARPSIVVHGGAGAHDADTEPARGLGRRGGGTSLDAVVAAVTRLEDDPLFNAGLGAVLTEDGTVELDASLMSGIDLRAGAVAMVRGVCNPILLARAVMDEGREVFLVGPPAEALARRHELRVVAPETLVTADARLHWEARRPAIGETVGAAACDALGHVAAATSTGGVGGQRSGRVGDSAVIGAGTYADDTLGAASATGPGEAIIRVGLVRTALEAVARGADVATAADEALAVLARRVGAAAGIILVDRHGRIAAAHTTPAMVTAQRSAP